MGRGRSIRIPYNKKNRLHRRIILLIKQIRTQQFTSSKKTWVKSADERNNEPISWESGFIVDKGNNLLELVCTHNSGRLEWYRGIANQITETVIEIEFHGVAIFNDDRMINSKCFYRFSSGMIEYEQEMRTTKVHESTRHLSAKLVLHQVG